MYVKGRGDWVSAGTKSEGVTVQMFSSHCGFSLSQRRSLGTFPGVQWIRLCVPSTGDLGLIPDQGTRSHTPQLRPEK